MDTQNNIKETFIGFVCRQFLVEPEEIDHDKSLVDEGIIDSFGLVEIATFIEQEFKIPVKDEDMKRENFGSVNKIVSFIERKC